MDIDREKIDDMTLALMYLVLHGDRYGTRAWKGFEWETLDRLFEQGWISDPKGKAKSVVMTEDGLERSKRLFEEYFAKS